MGNNVYLNGDILPIEKAQISVTDRGFLYGDALIETVRTYKKAPFMLKSHLQRLTKSAAELAFKMTISEEELKQAVYSVVKANDIEEGAIRITLTRGDSDTRSLYEVTQQPNLLISIFPLNQDEIARTLQGVNAISAEDRRSLFSNHKSNSMLASIMAYKQALDNSAFDMIQVTRRGFVTEGTRCNVFVVLDGILLTPLVGNRILPGISRNVAITIAKKNGIKVEEDAIVGQDLNSAEEIFLTNSLYEIIPAVSLNSKPVATGQKGQITSQIQRGYRLLVENWLDKIFTKV